MNSAAAGWFPCWKADIGWTGLLKVSRPTSKRSKATENMPPVWFTAVAPSHRNCLDEPAAGGIQCPEGESKTGIARRLRMTDRFSASMGLVGTLVGVVLLSGFVVGQTRTAAVKTAPAKTYVAPRTPDGQ